MKKYTGIYTVIGSAIILIGGFLGYELKKNQELQAQLVSKRQDLSDSRAASRKLESLEKQSQDLKQKEEQIYRRVPLNEETPLSLIKEILHSGTQIGMRQVNVEVLKDASQGQTDDSGSGGPSAPGDPGMSMSSSFSGDDSGYRKIALRIECEATFPQILAFIAQLAKFDRLVSLENIKIERLEKLLPYQKATLRLTTYAF